MPTLRNSSEWLVEYLTAESLDEARSFLAIHPGLVNATSEKILDVLARNVPGDRGRYMLNLRLLSRANAVGLDTAYGELSGLVPPQNLDQLAKEYLQSRYVSDGARFLQQHQELFAGGAEFVLADLAGASPEEGRAHALVLLSFYVVARQSDPSTALKQVYEGRADTYEWQAWNWAKSQYDNTGNARYLDLAILCMEGAIAGPVFVRLEPAQQAAAYERAGLVHYKRAQHRAGVHDLDVAVTYYERALQIESDPAHALERLGTLGALWIGRYERSGDPVDLDRGVKQLEAAMPRDVIGQDPLSVPMATSLGNGLRHRYMVSGDPSDIARAVSLHERIADVPADLATRGLRLTNLVASVMSRYFRNGDLADLDRAIQLGRLSLDGAPDDAPWRATASNNLARCLETRFRFSDQVQDLLDAIEHFGKALELGPVHERTRNATNLGLALVAYYKRQKDDSALEQAIETLRSAAELAAIGGIERSRPFEALGGALVSRFFQSRSREDLDEAIHVGRIAVRLAAGNTPLLSSHCGGLANAYNARFEAYGDAKDLRHSAALFRKASKAGMKTHPESTLTAAVSWGGTAIKRRAWKEGAEAYRYAFRASEALFTSQRDRRRKETRLREVQGLGARAAYVLARDGKLKEAVVALERARALLVADALSQGLSPAGRPLTYARIASAAAAAPIVYIELVSDAGFALIVKSKEEPRCVWLPELNESALRGKLNPLYVEGYNNRREDPERWQQLLDETASWLWPSVTAPILEAIKGQPEVVLIPGDILPFAPLHAAWTTDDAQPTGRKYAADGVVFRYLPSARAWLSIADRTRILPEAVLCVQEPSPATVEPLPNAHLEVSAVAAKFPAARILAGADAEASRVAAELANVSLAHFACHAFANKKEPLAGGLIMSNDAVLSLSQAFSMQLTRLRLAVLSACETGVMGQMLPDEAVSLPTGLMQAGVPGVVASLWSVPDISTALLMSKFYDLWPGPDMSPARALNEAQKWVRETTNGDMAKQLRGRSPLFKELILRDPDSRDFSAVADWAAFYVTGG